ncbi:hypothetical protein OCL90_14625, partial [Enterococcus faecalis]|nr:hypothetical protein [Enterococcus faecalis]
MQKTHIKHKSNTEYQDPTDVDEVQDDTKNGVIDPVSQTFALWIRTKVYRRHVRESLARMSLVRRSFICTI